jgi:hypothetical protein
MAIVRTRVLGYDGVWRELGNFAARVRALLEETPIP